MHLALTMQERERQPEISYHNTVLGLTDGVGWLEIGLQTVEPPRKDSRDH